MRKSSVVVSPDVYLEINRPNVIDFNNSFKDKLLMSDDDVRYKRDSFGLLRSLERVVSRVYSSNDCVDTMIASSGVAIASLISLSKRFNSIYYVEGTYPEMILAYSQLGNAKLFRSISQLENSDIVCIESTSVPNCSSNHQLIEDIVKIVHEHGAYVLVDTTCETGYNYNPIALGVDFVIESLSKIATGFNTSLLGALVVNDNEKAKEIFLDIKELKRYYRLYAHPIDVLLCLLGILTLGIRLDRIVKSSSAIYSFLTKNNISFRCILRSGLFFIDIEHSLNVSELKDIPIFLIADTFGANFTVITRWSQPDVLRISIGIEDQDDLIEAFNKLILNRKIKRI